MRALTVAELIAATQGVLLHGSSAAVATSVSTDSRSIGEGALFVPIVGENFDGHDYVNKALAAGASVALTARGTEDFLPGKSYILVDDTRLALKNLAAWYRTTFSIPFLQITGSVGKTTTKEMVAAVLSERYTTLKTAENFNNDIGTPLTILGLEAQHEVAVIETGMDHFGEIRYLGEIVHPEIALITNVGDAHIEFLGSREGILAAKSEIFENLHPDGFAVLNGDDPLLNTVKIPQRIVRCGESEGCDVRVSDIEESGIEGVRCTVTTSRARYDLTIPSPGRHMIYPAAMAVAVGEALGLSVGEICRGIAAYTPTGARMRICRLGGGRMLLEDCYNANPQSMGAALKILSGAEGRRVAVLGNMGELGDLADQAHYDMGHLTGELGIDQLIAIGPRAKLMERGALEAGCPEVRAYETKEEAYEDIAAAYGEGMTLLLKASLYTGRFEHIAAYLKEKFGVQE